MLSSWSVTICQTYSRCRKYSTNVIAVETKCGNSTYKVKTTYLVFSFNQFRLDIYALDPVVRVISPAINTDMDWLRGINATVGRKIYNKIGCLIMLPVCAEMDVHVLDSRQYSKEGKSRHHVFSIWKLGVTLKHILLRSQYCNVQLTILL